MSWFQYLKLIFKLKQVADIYEEEKGTGKPWYYSRRFVGAVVFVICGAIATHYNIKVDEMTAQQITNNVFNLINFVLAAASTAGTLYGVIMGIVGQIKKVPKK